MAVLPYLPHLLYSTALTSLAMHHLFQRKALEADRAHVAAQLSILDDLRVRLGAGERIPEREFGRLWRLAQSHDVWRARAAGASGAGEAEESEIGWKEVLFGKRFDSAKSDEWDRKDLERARKEVEETSS
ncbi:hypothetical protein C2E23DRAFT_869537 [Lenzites betulinus]|nr:hypothetical protein C2E23DRAFT_869537 [Lenzites betulinus]